MSQPTLFEAETSSDPLPKAAKPAVAEPDYPTEPKQVDPINGHELTSWELSATESRWKCAVCGGVWKRPPEWRPCPKVMMYKWGKWPEHLLTKKQMGDAGFQTGGQLPAPAGGCYREKSPGGIMYLYDRGQGVPKKVLSDEQKAKNKAAMDAAKLCPRCKVGSRVWTHYEPRYRKGRQQGYWSEHGWWPYCQTCQSEIDDIERCKSVAAEFKRWMDADCLILDTETSSLEGEIIEIAVIDSKGNVLLNQRLNPKYPNEILTSGAYRIHGIHPRDLGLCPTFHELYPQLWPLLEGRLVVIFNKSFDVGMLQGDCWRWKLPKLKFKAECAMLEYSRYVGDWLDYHGDYRWQRLDGGDHSALGDCRAVLSMMREIIEKEAGNDPD